MRLSGFVVRLYFSFRCPSLFSVSTLLVAEATRVAVAQADTLGSQAPRRLFTCWWSEFRGWLRENPSVPTTSTHQARVIKRDRTRLVRARVYEPRMRTPRSGALSIPFTARRDSIALSARKPVPASLRPHVRMGWSGMVLPAAQPNICGTIAGRLQVSWRPCDGRCWNKMI